MGIHGRQIPDYSPADVSLLIAAAVVIVFSILGSQHLYNLLRGNNQNTPISLQTKLQVGYAAAYLHEVVCRPH
jgi:hypothetical protein